MLVINRNNSLGSRVLMIIVLTVLLLSSCRGRRLTRIRGPSVGRWARLLSKRQLRLGTPC